MTVGRRINELRLARGESLQEVAAASGASKTHIWQLEKGRTDNPSMALLTRLADHFRVSIRYLIDEDVEAHDVNEDLARMFRQARELDEYHRRILDDMLQSFLKSGRVRNRDLPPPDYRRVNSRPAKTAQDEDS